MLSSRSKGQEVGGHFYEESHMGLEATKPVFRVSDKSRLKPISSARKLKFHL